jgi:DNA uptake protein ComE-like DNA-binding protein
VAVNTALACQLALVSGVGERAAAAITAERASARGPFVDAADLKRRLGADIGEAAATFVYTRPPSRRLW